MPKTPVTIEYERDVISTAEGSTLAAMLNDLDQLLAEGPEAKIFRRIYGTELEGDVSELRRLVRTYDQWLDGYAILVGNPDTLSGVQKVDEKIVAPDAVAKELTKAKIYKKSGAEWASDDFVPAGVSDESRAAYQSFYGYPLVTVTEADLGEIERIAELAANIGVSLDRVDLAQLPQMDTPGASLATKFRIVTNFVAQLRDMSLEPFEGANADVMRFRAQRPGGGNFDSKYQAEANLSALTTRITEEIQNNLENLGTGRLSYSDIQQYEMAKVGFSPNEANYVKAWAVQRPDNYAVLRIVSGGGARSPDPYNADTGYTVHYQTNRFLLESVSENSVERAAFVETFGPTYLYLFGTKAKIWNYAGTVIDSEGFTWLNEWRQAYERYTGGTKTAKLKARCFLTYDNVVREGIIIGAAISKSIGEYGYARLSFQMFIIREHYLDGSALKEQVTSLPTFLSEREPVQAVEEQYAVTLRDVTPERESFKTVTGRSAEALAVENALFARKKDAIEDQIERKAFPNGRLAHVSGTIETDLTNEAVRNASQAFADQSSDAKGFRKGRSLITPQQARDMIRFIGEVKSGQEAF